MSYCRWSSCDFKSDVYVYENINGAWTIHVAGQSYPRDAEDRVVMDLSKMAEISLPHAGEAFDTASPDECADKLEELAALGYFVPDWVVPDLRRESLDTEEPTQ